MGNGVRLKEAVRIATPRPLRLMRRRLMNFRTEAPLRRFVLTPPPDLSRKEALTLVNRFTTAHDHLDCAHTHSEMDAIVRAIFAFPRSVPGCIVEAGCFKGGSTVKLSVAAAMSGRTLVVFDSFQGLPDNEEHHGLTIHGDVPDFSTGKYQGTLEEVKENVARFGRGDVCEFVRGWFDQTMPEFDRQVAVAFIDVDLQASTRTCLQYLYPLLAPGGSIFSHDGHLPLCIEAMNDDEFWLRVVGCPKPPMSGLGVEKLVRIMKPTAASPPQEG